jgi:hypothetical protein
MSQSDHIKRLLLYYQRDFVLKELRKFKWENKESFFDTYLTTLYQDKEELLIPLLAWVGLDVFGLK